MPSEFIDTNIMLRKLGFDVSAIRVVINRISQECGSEDMQHGQAIDVQLIIISPFL